ncbi:MULTISPECIES: hypothetical protein [Rhodococcus]|uniref:hypothetical protein n=1 Tax=Rhodococcus TaxID=1827 RepID=UPI0013572601|nr:MULTISPECIES: hypothetical protein [Rhodococcus]KAF0957561.1 hypothetical protein MLGJGCBP_09393 [Rhodococcus sp. T7]KAF0963736.1 hypothetical protein MLGJGCBP_03132 [Rhodococcus sp. T7]QQZ18230.1 hypothetical protein GO592_38945 [Rhodococcus sp. 21391]UOT08159.1 hypothetical protein MPY17_38040 [Rhodococcus opacus]
MILIRHGDGAREGLAETLCAKDSPYMAAATSCRRAPTTLPTTLGDKLHDSTPLPAAG